METAADSDEQDYIVLSGGLGSSEYLKKKLEVVRWPSSQPQLLSSTSPIMCVAQGLILERVQRLGARKPIENLVLEQASTASYGFLYNETPDFKDKAKNLWRSENKPTTTGIKWFLEKVRRPCSRGNVTEG